MNSLLTKAFDIQRQLDEVLSNDFEIIDTGMMIPDGTENVLWRDMTIENKKNRDEYYCFSYSTNGELKGETPLNKTDLIKNTITK